MNTPCKPRYPWLEMALIIGLPLLVLAAGVVTTGLAMQRGFTQIETVSVQVPR